MRLTEVRLEHFRNLADTGLEVPPEGAVLVGANGQGKTNFLEAVHYLSRFRSFRAAGHVDAIAFGADHFRIEAGFLCEERPRTLALSGDRERRRIVLDGAPVGRPRDAAGALLAVSLRPEDLELVAGPPSVRRAYLDELLGLVSRSYRRALAEYDRVLRQRNELLRSGRGTAQLEAWDEALISSGVPVVAARAGMVGRLAERFARIAARVAAGAAGGYGIAYRPSVPVDPAAAEREDETRVVWSRALVERYEVDRARGWTTVGPHRDELAIALDGRELARYGSQGECRTAAVALRLMEAEELEADTGRRPILLLDDVFSELDGGRGERLLDWLGGRHQRFVTSPRPLDWLADGLAVWTVSGGCIACPAPVAVG